MPGFCAVVVILTMNGSPLLYQSEDSILKSSQPIATTVSPRKANAPTLSISLSQDRYSNNRDAAGGKYALQFSAERFSLK
jgi:hypothetical protein